VGGEPREAARIAAGHRESDSVGRIDRPDNGKVGGGGKTSFEDLLAGECL
jgi:hypothetical protein